MSRSVLLALALVALLAPLAGCGDSGPSTEDFHAEADEICKQQTKSFVETEEALGTPVSLEDNVAFQEELIPIRADVLAELEDVEPPDEHAGEWERYLETRRELAGLRDRQVALSEKGDEKALEPVNAEIGELNDELERTARKIGLEACAWILPAEQRAEAEDLVEEVAFTTDPKLVCRELVTPGYLDFAFGGSYEECAKFQRRNADKFATEIEIEDVDGVEDTQALVTITDVDGQYAGEESAWNLVRKGGDWRVLSISTP